MLSSVSSAQLTAAGVAAGDCARGRVHEEGRSRGPREARPHGARRLFHVQQFAPRLQPSRAKDTRKDTHGHTMGLHGVTGGGLY